MEHIKYSEESSAPGQFETWASRLSEVRSSPNNGHLSAASACPKSAISVIFGLSRESGHRGHLLADGIPAFEGLPSRRWASAAAR